MSAVKTPAGQKGGEDIVTLHVMRQDEVTAIGLSGDIDMQEVVDIRNAISNLVQAGCTQLVLDLSRVQHINATGIGILADSLRRLRALDGDLRLAQPNPYLQNVLELTGMSRIIRIYPRREDAIKSYKRIDRVAA